MRFLLLSLALLLAACAPTSQYNVRDARPPYPAPDLSQLTDTEALGLRLYYHDRAAWIATDELTSRGANLNEVAGYLSFDQDDGSILVRFAGPCNVNICSKIDVSIFNGRVVGYEKTDEPLPADHLAAWRARHSALNSGFRACSQHYNTIVLPWQHENSPAYRVYLLAASQEPDEIVMGGHHRFLASNDGKTLIENEPLSMSCMTMQISEDVVAPMTTHVLHEEPLETHVFTSLDHHIPLYVGTSKGVFKVDGASISLLELGD
ncbi:hypothetical protein [Wenzhouxiangella marina]|uniref:Uncharacterized protein n=1 Tax=Wenzhouxiangella marina TaxID=1579979 RepID=A0A0K0XUJ8_9GAMM|nr:hypothetical protein [Wenzhouxiangella marina]AKS41340.1 hypothetical protein WM2015_959 [Wenzhouxiangella marina]MBB6086910.1 hypothetical protein [Wenzhouxiangella marina]